MKYTPGRNYGQTVVANVERLRAAGLHESIPCTAADNFLANGVIPRVKRGGRPWGQGRETGLPGRAYLPRAKSSRFFGVTCKANGKIYAQINRKDHRWFPPHPFDTELEAYGAVLNELKRFEEAAA